nr:ribonuclease H-like domain-containing protein [Tanacetum cinerariifolium]
MRCHREWQFLQTSTSNHNNADGTSTSSILDPVTTKEKAQKKNDVKDKSMLLMALPNEHLLTFCQYKDAKTLFEAIQARFGGNDVTKKTQRTLLKQMYENFNAPSIKSHNFIFNGLHKIVSQLAILVCVVSTPVSIVSSHDNTANLSDATVYTFSANQPNGSQLVHEDLEQIHEDDLEEMDLKWQLALLREERKAMFGDPELELDTTILFYFLFKNFEIVVKVIKAHSVKMCFVSLENHTSFPFNRSLRNQERKPRNQDNSRKTMIVEDTSSKVMVAIDGVGSQITDNNKTGLGFTSYNDVAPPPTGLFVPPSIDLSNSGLEEFQHPELKGYGPKDSKSVCIDTSNEIKKAPDGPIIED